MGKKIDLAKNNFDNNKEYSLEEAIKLAKKLAFEGFDPSIDVSFNLNLNVKKADQQLRGAIILPHGTGKVKKVLVVGDKEDQDLAKKAKADYIGDEKILEKIAKENWFPFDFIVTTPRFMSNFAKYGRILGPKGLMPNPKLGTVTEDIVQAIENIKRGQIEYRTNDQGVINLTIGKSSFKLEELLDNYRVVLQTLKNRRPTSVKGSLIKGIYLSTTMGPGIKISKDGGI